VPVPLAAPPLVLTDFTAEPYSPSSMQAVAEVIAPSCDAVLIGEHQNRPDFPPTMHARMLLEQGVRPWMTLACRDRNRIVLEQELIGLRHVGVDAVLCVTGDARGYDVRPDVTQVFDLDGPRLTGLAASLGLSAAVAETPTAPPREQRGIRLAQKQRAGAAVAILNHCSVADVAMFLRDAKAAGVSLPVIAAAAVYTDEVSAGVLAGLPGLDLNADAVARVLGAADPVAAGVATAVQEARELLNIDGVVGINVSGLASGRGYIYAAQVKAEVGLAVRGAHDG
jgi:methylenetetrahydrofolate reductase (NADPH)